MTKEQTKEVIKVMQAYVDGKKIERFDNNSNKWVEEYLPFWNWGVIQYRIKPEPKYRPFNSAEEVLEAIKEHGDWVKQGNDIYRRIDKITTIGNNVCISLSGMKDWGINELNKIGEFTFPDGTPFGKLEE